MSIFRYARKYVGVLGIALIGVLAPAEAPAQGFGFGGGFGFGPGGGRPGGVFGGPGGRPLGGFGPGRIVGPRVVIPGPGCFGGRCGRPRIVVRPVPIWRPRPVIVRVPIRRPWWYYVKRPYYVRRPYVAPVPFVAAAVARPPVSCPTPVTNIAANTPEPQFVFVIFQQNATAVDTASFLKTYSVLVDDGPNQDGYFKLKLASPLSPDRMNEMISSMRTQTNVVSEVTGS